MPVLISPQDKEYWFNSSHQQVEPLFMSFDENLINIERRGDYFKY
jgi:hypothetical protein